MTVQSRGEERRQKMSAGKMCRRCNKPVMKNADHYETFENMHWLRFHLEYEHEGDTDTPCSD